MRRIRGQELLASVTDSLGWVVLFPLRADTYYDTYYEDRRCASFVFLTSDNARTGAARAGGNASVHVWGENMRGQVLFASSVKKSTQCDKRVGKRMSYLLAICLR